MTRKPVQHPTPAFYQATALGVGLLACCLLFAVLSPMLTQVFRVYVKNTVHLENFRDYYLFAPAQENARKYAFISSSFYAQNDVLNEAGGHNRAHPGGYIGQLANHLLASEYDSNLRFYDFGRSKTSSYDHLWFFYQFLQAPGAEGVFYTAGIENISSPGSGSNSERNYVTLAVLAAIAKRYTGLQPQVRLLENHLHAHLGTTRAQAEIALQQKIDPDTLLLKVDNRAENVRLAFVTDNHHDTWPLLASVARLRDGILQWLVYSLTNRQTDPDKSIQQQYTDAVAQYGKPVHDKPNLVRKASVKTRDGHDRIEAAFYDLLVGIAEIEGINLVFYHPPMYLLPPQQYWQILRPRFFDRFEDRYGGRQHVYIIDHVYLPGVNQFDFTYTHRDACAGLCKDGYRLGIIGNLKRVRALFAELQRVGILQATNRSQQPGAFIEEASLPAFPLCLKIVGLEDLGCIYEARDYRADSPKAQLPLRAIVAPRIARNPYIKQHFFDAE